MIDHFADFERSIIQSDSKKDIVELLIGHLRKKNYREEGKVFLEKLGEVDDNPKIQEALTFMEI